MKYEICPYPYGSGTRYAVWLMLGRNWYSSKYTYSTRRAALRAAKRAGGTEEIK